jgi:hypothetical protein
MRVTVFKVLALVLVLGAVYVAIFQREWAMNLFRKGVQEAKGYRVAQTPSQAAELFCKAMKNRDYDTARELYCTGDYAEQIQKVEGKARDLGKQIDKLLAKLENKDIRADRAKTVLRLMDPFPTTVEVHDVKEEGEDKASFILKDTKPVEDNDVTAAAWRFNPPIIVRALYMSAPPGGAAPPSQVRLDLKRVEKDGKQFWKVDTPVTPYMRGQVAELEKKTRELITVLDKLYTEIDNEPTTKEDFEGRFKELVQKAMR